MKMSDSQKFKDSQAILSRKEISEFREYIDKKRLEEEEQKKREENLPVAFVFLFFMLITACFIGAFGELMPQKWAIPFGALWLLIFGGGAFLISE